MASTPRSLARLHSEPLRAFESLDPGMKGSLDLKTCRLALQNLGAAPSALEMVALARQFGDGQTIDYRRFLAAQEGPASAASAASSPPPRRAASSASSASSSSMLRSPKPGVPGNPARPDGSVVRPEGVDSSGSRLLRFESDSTDRVLYTHGNSALQIARPGFNARQGVKVYFPQRDVARASTAQVLQAAAEAGIAEASPPPSRLPHAPHNSSGLLVEAGGVGAFVSNSTAASTPSRPSFREHAAGNLATLGGVVAYMNDESWRDGVPDGFAMPLPHGMGGDVPTRKGPAAPLHNTTKLVSALGGVPGVAAWGADGAFLDADNAAHRARHRDPQHHGSEIRDAGGLAGVAASPRTWLQDTPTAPGRQVQTTPEQLRRLRSQSATRNRRSGRAVSPANRRRSVPGLLWHEVTEPRPAADHDVSPGTVEGAGVDADTDAGVGEGVGAGDDNYSRLDRRLYQEHFNLAGPVTNALTGEHHGRPSRIMGTCSPVAVRMAANLRPDLRLLAVVRKRLRARLPAKAAAAAAVLRARLGGLDGDRDGHLTDGELLAALSDLTPEVQADEVGLLVRYMRARNARRAVSAREAVAVAGTAAGAEPASVLSASAGSAAARSIAPALSVSGQVTSAEEVAQLSVATAGFGEGISIADLAEWVSLQPGGADEVQSPLAGSALAGLRSITTFSGSPPSPAEDAADPFAHHSHKAQRTGRFAVEFEEGRHHFARAAPDSSAARDALSDPSAAFVDTREQARDAEGARLLAAERDEALDLASLGASSFSGSAASGGGRRRRAHGHSSSAASTYSGFHEARRAAAAHHALGSALVPSAGVLSGPLKTHEGKGRRSEGDSAFGESESTAAEAGGDEQRMQLQRRKQRAQLMERFEAFRVSWEERHGAPARKEAALDAQVASEGRTWSRYEPQAFKVLHLASPPSSGAVTVSGIAGAIPGRPAHE